MGSLRVPYFGVSSYVKPCCKTSFFKSWHPFFKQFVPNQCIQTHSNFWKRAAYHWVKQWNEERGWFCYSILGMYLFGGKFCMLADGSRECDCEEIIKKDPKCVCDRKHFNNVLWATVTVFQVGATLPSLHSLTLL